MLVSLACANAIATYCERAMKVALVHEWFVDWAGSERVVEQILACFPTADVFSLVDFLSPENRARIQNKKVTTTFLQRMPWARSHLHLYLPFMPIAIEQLDLSAYDVIISSSHAVAKGIITGPDQTHISYVHSPMRYAWDLQHDYLRGAAGRGLRGTALRSLLHYLRLWDSRTPAGVDAFVANSHFISRRIGKVYGRTSHVIHPPVDVCRFEVQETKQDFYVAVGRLMPYKRTDLLIAAFREMPTRRLVIIGEGPEMRSLKKVAPPNVKLLGFQSESTVREHLQRAQALLFAATEDFGIVPVEAQACGTPVIAYGRGGALETISTDPARLTGLFFESQSVAAIVNAVERFEQRRREFVPATIRANAERFSCERFRERFQAHVRNVLSQRGGEPDSCVTKEEARLSPPCSHLATDGRDCLAGDS